MGNRKAEHSELLSPLTRAHEISRDDLRCPLALPVLNMRHRLTVHKPYRPSEDKKKITKWQRTSSQESDEHRYEFGVIYVRYIFKVRKLEE